MPIRSPRRLYEIEEVTLNLDDNPDAIDSAPDQTAGGLKSPIFIKMKEAIAEYLGMEPIGFNDPRLTGIFQGNGLNKGSEYRRRLGGFRVAGYTLIAETKFTLTEEYYDKVTQSVIRAPKDFRTMTIGFPKGHSVHEVITWLAGQNNFSTIRALRSPSGVSTDLFDPT